MSSRENRTIAGTIPFIVPSCITTDTVLWRDSFARSLKLVLCLRSLAQVTLPLPSPNKNLGYVADQTLFSYMSTKAAGGRDLFYQLPCGWNHQMSLHYSVLDPTFLRYQICDTPCNLVHGNERQFKKTIDALQGDPTGRACRPSLDHLRCNVYPYNSSTMFASHILDFMREKCCSLART